jgi:enoyl-CoA hydratase/carnithine racemase
MTYTQILYSVADQIATITLNRPEKMNAFTGTMMKEIMDAFDRLDADDDVRAVVITGAGGLLCWSGSNTGRWQKTLRQRRDS